jgi:hypothetical protein
MPKMNLSLFFALINFFMVLSKILELGMPKWGTPLLVGFTDSNWVDNPDDQKSIAGYVFILGLRPVTWA